MKRNEIDRIEINGLMADYLAAGGTITNVPIGVSGVEIKGNKRTQKEIRNKIRMDSMAKHEARSQ